MINKKYPLLLLLSALLFINSCVTTSKGIYSSQGLTKDDLEFLKGTDSGEDELFRVFLTSDHYIVSQLKNNASIQRVPDQVGDAYICNAVKRFDMINETGTGVVSIVLTPDSGQIISIRPKESTNLIEVDKLIIEDMQRWCFSFPAKVVEMTKFTIRYRVKLQKRLSDDEILKEVRDTMREKQ